MKYEWKKSEKKYYLPKPEPELIKIPSFNFYSIEGKGNPNDEFFSEYIEALYSLSYAVKMAPKSGKAPKNYFDYTVYPLEGIWDISEEAKKRNNGKMDKNDLVFNLMIRQPYFVTEEYSQEIIEKTKKKKPSELLNSVKFVNLEEGECMQIMHIGSYDNESISFKIMEEYCDKNNLIRGSMKHREIYLSDVRKVAPEKLRTVLRFKVRQKA